MKNQRIIHFLLLMAYLFSPTLLTWVLSPNGSWYRPYLFWMAVVLATFLFQVLRPKTQNTKN